MKRFDDRQTCFHTGKKISPPMIDRRRSACFGLRIVKGVIVEVGPVGEDCAALIQQRLADKALHGSTVEQFVERYKGKPVGTSSPRYAKLWKLLTPDRPVQVRRATHKIKTRQEQHHENLYP
ncbi:hypothetical protein [Pseudomonas sp.]|uniref:hypothetical protein n=1 Tax=Pseudomonas sp. TaxID=306 RepID=UPI0025894C31|nr:hypothetical protein [Pseudomonas sp.]